MGSTVTAAGEASDVAGLVPLQSVAALAAIGAMAAADAADATLRSIAASNPGAAERWRRPNYRGRPVSLLGGHAAAAIALAAVIRDRRSARRVRFAALIAGGVAAVAGAVDDHYGSSATRGLRGHLRAARRGEITTGAWKIAAIGAAGLLAGSRAGPGGPVRTAIAGVVVAGSANLANLLDLRPGRALKAVAAATVPIALRAGDGAALAAATAGVAAGLLPADLGERAMLGDAGANCLGALAGTAFVAGASTRALVAGAVAVTGLTALSEIVSFTRVIDTVPPLRFLDRLGRRSQGTR